MNSDAHTHTPHKSIPELIPYDVLLERQLRALSFEHTTLGNFIDEIADAFAEASSAKLHNACLMGDKLRLIGIRIEHGYEDDHPPIHFRIAYPDIFLKAYPALRSKSLLIAGLGIHVKNSSSHSKQATQT